MKSLIIFVAVLALGKAQNSGSAEWDKCKPEVEKLKTCFSGKMEEAAKTAKAEGDKLEAECKTCFDGVKCIWPEFPKTEPTHAPPSAEAIACFKGAATKFGSCMKEKLNLPESFNMTAEMESHHKDGEKPEKDFGHFHMPSKVELKKYAMQFCKNDTAAADALLECGTKKFEGHKEVFASLMNPLASICKYKNECAIIAPISPDCDKLLKKGAQAFCNCSKQGKIDFETSDSCKSTRDSIHEAFKKETSKASKDHHDMPHHDDFDFCKLDLEKDICADSAKKSEAMKSKLEAMKSKYEEMKKGSASKPASASASASATGNTNRKPH